jgi:ribonuclease P/MRP protein subunit RPP1
MYEAVQARPDGRSTVARVAATAADQGYEGVVVRNHGDHRADYDPQAVAESTGVDVVPGLEIRADGPEQASGYLGNYRADNVVLAVHGGPEAMNRFAVGQDRVDVLAHPTREGAFDQGTAKAAAEHGVRIEFDLTPVLRGDGGARVQALRRLRTARDLVAHFDVPHVVTGGARSHLQLRAHRELVAVGDAVGLGAEFVREGLREWERLVERNRERLSDRFIEPGVRRGRHEEEP